ncbi:MAG: maleylpyruvate isomerase family mycothiol-dependent enzyme [Acidimicrobiales bacterium]
MDVFALIAAERRRLADALDDLSVDEWATPSLCGAWTVHQVVAHLNVPFDVSAWSFVVAMAKARGRFDVANDRLARDLAARMGPAECTAGLRANAEHRFTPPGHGPEAPLTDVIVHGCDALHPVGRRVEVAPDAVAVALSAMVSRGGGRGFPVRDLDRLRLVPDDVDLVVGQGDLEVAGPGRSILAAVLGRTDMLGDLRGDGVAVLGGA